MFKFKAADCSQGNVFRSGDSCWPRSPQGTAVDASLLLPGSRSFPRVTWQGASQGGSANAPY